MNGEKAVKTGMRNIIFLGLVSCFADVSSEMVYPIIPLYLTAVLGATPALVGVIEGIAESVASLPCRARKAHSKAYTAMLCAFFLAWFAIR